MQNLSSMYVSNAYKHRKNKSLKYSKIVKQDKKYDKIKNIAKEQNRKVPKEQVNNDKMTVE